MTKGQLMAKSYLNVGNIKFDPDYNQIFGIDTKGRRYPLAYVEVTRIMGALNTDLTPTKEDLYEAKNLVAQFIIEAIEEKLNKTNATFNESEKGSK
jgi:hypothetical protein